jgi:prepilin-type N-terminal cleavage/methylation domain-containing protein
MTSRLRSQHGFTLIEMMVAVSIGAVVMLATFSMLDSSVVLTGKTEKRVDATQRGRLAMFQITRALGSQVCPNATTPAIVGTGVTGQPASDQYTADFWMFTGTGTFTPVRHVIAWDTNTNSIIDTAYNQAGTKIKQSTLLTKVRPTGSSAPVFTYWAYPANGTTPSSQLNPTGAALSPAQAATVALIKVSFIVQPDTTATPASTTSTPPQSQTFSDQVFVRTADPNDPKGPQAPLCA